MHETVSTLKGDSGFSDKLHHIRLVWQYKFVRPKKGFAAVLYSGDRIDLEHQPRVGERTWVAETGKQLDSSDIRRIIDSSEYGAH